MRSNIFEAFLISWSKGIPFRLRTLPSGFAEPPFCCAFWHVTSAGAMADRDDEGGQGDEEKDFVSKVSDIGGSSLFVHLPHSLPQVVHSLQRCFPER